MTLNPLPRFCAARQRFPEAPPLDLRAILRAELTPLLARVRPGARIALALGSRGIANLRVIAAAVIDSLQSAGAQPFIVPAMGSHGGGTPEGQLALLAGYGITEASLGVPIRALMETTVLGATADGRAVHFSTEALSADAIVVVNRVKPHTDFGGPLGSGLLKMLVVGLGKRNGAATFHAAASRQGYEAVIRASARIILNSVPLLAGVAILEDQRHQTARIQALGPQEIEAVEPRLCAEARLMAPRLPLDDVDLLIIDRLGKNLSGTGMDPAILGRSISGYVLADDPHRPPPRVRRVFVRELTPETHGNAIGIGMADFTTSRLARAIDWPITYVNSITSLSLQGVKLPLHFETDREVIDTALGTLAVPDTSRAKVVRIADTLSLEHLLVSEACLADLRKCAGVEVVDHPQPLTFDSAGNLPPFEVAAAA